MYPTYVEKHASIDAIQSPLLCCAVIKMNFENHSNAKVVESWWQLADIFAFEKTGKTLKTLLKSDRRFRRYSFFQDSHDLGWLPLANERFWPKNHFSLFSTLFPPKFISGHPLTTLWWNLSKIRTPGLLDKLMMMAMPEIWWQFLPTKSKIERQNTF